MNVIFKNLNLVIFGCLLKECPNKRKTDSRKFSKGSPKSKTLFSKEKVLYSSNESASLVDEDGHRQHCKSSSR